MERGDTPKRYREISMVLSKHGFEWMWARWGVGKIFGRLTHPGGDTATHALSQPERLRFVFEELGTTFIKIGQLLSTRPDLLPDEYVAELSKLQDQAPEVPYPEIEKVIVGEFGRPPQKIFRSFETSPRAAASIAQVHDAILPDGTAVVVKVRRPNLEERVDQDLAVLGQVARFLTEHTELGQRFDIESLMEEFANSLRAELDFTREGHNAEQIAAQFPDDVSLHVPTIFWDFSTHAVLTMEAISGIKISDLKALDEAGIDRPELAKRCAHIAMVQVLEHGFFHADPHPGNFFVYPDGVIALLDYGMVGRISGPSRESLLRLGIAVSRRDAQRLVDELFNLGAVRGNEHRQALERDLDDLISRYVGRPLGELSATEIFHEITRATQRHGIVLPSNFVMLARVVALDEGLGATLDPSFNFIEFSQPYFKRFWRRNYSVRAISRRMREGAIDLADMGGDLPRRLLRIVGQLERGDIKVKSELDVPEELPRSMRLAANRIAVSILTAGLIVGLSVLAVVYRPAGSEGFGYFLLKALLALGVASGIWLAVALLRSSRR